MVSAPNDCQLLIFRGPVFYMWRSGQMVAHISGTGLEFGLNPLQSVVVYAPRFFVHEAAGGFGKCYSAAQGRRRGRGGIGRHARFRFWWRKPWGFKSLRPHHIRDKRLSTGPHRRSGGTLRSTRKARAPRGVELRSMQITETVADGLKRELEVVLAADELTERRDMRLDELKDTVQIKGFRRGKVPLAHLKKVYGRQLMAEILQAAVEETSQKAIDERDERPANQPKIDFPEDEATVESVIEGKADLSYSMSYEIIPKFEVVDFGSLKLERLTSDVEDEEIDKAIKQLAERNVAYEPVEDEASGEGYKVTVDFEGKIEGEAFEGGTAEGIELFIGQGGFIPGFEEGIKGAKSGEQRVVNVTFPEDYPVDTLKGKEAVFDVVAKEVAKPKEPEIDDEFAKTLGADSLEKLREMVSEQMEREYAQVSRMKLKRALLDELNERHDFDLPPSLVDAEFDGIWNQVTQRMQQEGRTFEDEEKSEAELRKDYRDVAEPRVRLG